MSDSETIVRLKDIGYRYPSGLVALRGVDMSIRRGQIVGIVGPSGCGKSTLLHLMARLSAPTDGTIVRSDDHASSLFLTMVFQKDTLLPWMTVAENVGLHYRLNKIPRSEWQPNVDRLLEMAGLRDFDDNYPYQLSGGMKRRVAVLAALAPRPSVLLMDEPFSSLDEPTRIAIHGEVHTLLRSIGTTCVLVTHDLEEAISLCDDVVIFTSRPGRVFESFKVPFGEERDMMALRQDEGFLNLYGRIWSSLSLQLKQAPPTTVEGAENQESSR